MSVTPAVGPLSRVYVPTTVAGLLALAQGGLPVTQAFAVTDRLRALLVVPDDAGTGLDDELAEAAVVAAADACLVLLGADPTAPRLRIVVAADTSTTGHGDPAHPAAVTCPAVIGLTSVVSLLCDDPDDPAATAAVRSALAAQDSGIEVDLEAAMDALDDHPLAWFDIGELTDLVQRMRRG